MPIHICDNCQHRYLAERHTGVQRCHLCDLPLRPATEEERHDWPKLGALLTQNQAAPPLGRKGCLRLG